MHSYGATLREVVSGLKLHKYVPQILTNLSQQPEMCIVHVQAQGQLCSLDNGFFVTLFSFWGLVGVVFIVALYLIDQHLPSQCQQQRAVH